MPRKFPIVQFPNPPLILAILAEALGRTTRGRLSHNATLLSRLALLLWSAEELTTGVNWFRRLLGTVGGVYAIADSIRLRSLTGGRSAGRERRPR